MIHVSCDDNTLAPGLELGVRTRVSSYGHPNAVWGPTWSVMFPGFVC